MGRRQALMPRHWFEDLADHMGPAYLRYSFTYGTEQEVGFLVDALELAPGSRVLDLGCGPGRHALALARRGVEVVGVDVAARFVELASAAAARESLPATFVRADARHLAYDGEFDAAISLCQGAFGLPERPPLAVPDADRILAGMARAVKRDGYVAVSAFSAYFQVRHLEAGDDFDAATGVNHEHTAIRDDHGHTRPAELWTACFTPRELRLLAERAGLSVDAVWSVEPGAYASRAPDTDHPEFLMIARRALHDSAPARLSGHGSPDEGRRAAPFD